MPLTTDQLAQFNRDGFVVVKSLYTREQMAQWKRIMTELIAAEPANKSGVRVWMEDKIHPTLREAMKDDKVTPILRQIIGPKVEFLSAKAVFKNAGTSFASPWHQDWFYWEGARKHSIWIALDNATVANGCLKFVPGTHHKVFQKSNINDGNAFVHRVTDEDLKGLREVTVEANIGDAVFFSDLAVHSSHPNVAGTDRWSLISTYRDASVKDESTVWATAMAV